MKRREHYAVTEIIATVLLLAVAISVFSVIYVVVLSSPVPMEESTAVVVGDIIDNTIILTHHGGKSLPFNEQSYQIQTSTGKYDTIIFEDLNENGLWDIGEQIRFSYEEISNEQITVTVIDLDTNDVILYGVFNDGESIIFETYVNTISPYEQTQAPLNITAENTSAMDKVTLWYDYSIDNETWQEWKSFGTDSSYADGWKWNFDFSNGFGYYQFYSIGQYNDNREQIPDTFDAHCFFNPMFSLNTTVQPFHPYYETDPSVTINATGDPRLDNVTLFYRFSSDNSTWSESSYDTIGEIRSFSHINQDWTTISFWNEYERPVVVCTNNLISKNDNEVCVRLSNVTGNSCDIRLQNPGDDHVITAGSVNLIVIEEGVHNLSDGRKLEAYRFMSSTPPDSKSSDHVGTKRSYVWSYTQPRVLAQVMTHNDQRFSVPLITDGSLGNPADADDLYVNLQVLEDSETTRASEEIGYIVIESGSGSMNNISYQAGRTADSVKGVDDQGYEEPLTGSFSIGVATLQAQDGGDGGWAVLYGSNPINSDLHVANEEDTINDEERAHTTEEVDFWVFSTSGNITSDKLDDQWMNPWTHPLNPDESAPYNWVFNFPDGQGFYEFYSIGKNQTKGTESPPSVLQPDAHCQFDIESSLNPLSSYVQTDETIELTANAPSQYDNISLYYRYSEDNSSWGQNETIGEIHIIENVGSLWKNISYWHEFNNPVIICTYALGSSSDYPAVVRVANVSKTSCTIKLQNPGDEHPVTANIVHVLIMEEGVHFLNDGRKVEAKRVLSDGTNHDSDWSSITAENVGYDASFTNPVVLGQVMSYNDSRWSSFWCMNGDESDPPDENALYVGKHVAEDSDTARASETLGYVVIEQGSGEIRENNNNLISYECGLGTDTIRGPGSDDYYDLDDTYVTGIATLNAMDGTNGGWSVLYGSNPFSSNRLYLANDEDMLKDSERTHTDEQDAYWVFSDEGNITSNKTMTGAEGFDWTKYDNNSNPDNESPWSWDVELSEGTGYYEFACIAMVNGFEESFPSVADAHCYYNAGSSPISYWPFDENSGTTIYDQSGTNNGTAVGAEWSTGIKNSCLDFNGSSDYVEIAASPDLDITGDKMSVEAWVRWEINPNVQTKEIIVYKAQNESWHPHYSLLHTTERFGFGVITEDNYESVYSSTIIQENTWYHLVGTYNGTHICLYVNGTNERTKTLTGNMKTSLLPVYIASQKETSSYFNGKIDEIDIYDQVLTQQEILARYNQLKP